MDGNEACAHVAYNFTEVAGIYPITPASPMAELVDSWAHEGKKNYFDDTVKVVEMQSEAGAAGMVHGSLQSGALTTTFTASQGLLLMIPNMYKMAGELLPAVIHVAARSLATHALSIFGDHQDIYAARATGFAILASSSVQQAMDLAGVAHLAAIKGRIPFLHFFDGFRTSHELQKIEVIDTEKLKKLIDQKALQEFRNRALNPLHPVTRGTSQNDDIYFQATEVRNKYYFELEDIVNDYMQEINKLTGRNYKPFCYYGDKNATKIIVAMGSVCETIKETIDELNKNGEKVGLMEVHLYRPFSTRYFLNELPTTVQKIAVLDRTKEAGSNGEPLYLDVASVISHHNKSIEVLGGRYGLSSKNTNPAMIKAVFDFLDRRDRFSGFTVGITDDVTHLSIPIPNFQVPTKATEFLIYGYGSDGMVSACKDIMKITGNATRAYVQGYFQYDSKKSGGVTKSHLRFSKEPIRSTYYVENPSVVVCTKDAYLEKFEMLNEIKPGGTFILDTIRDEKEALSLFSDHDKEIIASRNIKVYFTSALSLAKELGLDHKISAIMEAIIFKVGRIIDYSFATKEMKASLTKKFANKGNQIAEKNCQAVDRALEVLKKINVKELSYQPQDSQPEATLFAIMDQRKGDTLPVSAFVDQPDGTFESGLSRLEKRGASDIAPCYHPENCIMCNQCSFVCPHAVIRPFLLDEEEAKNAPKSLQKKLLDTKLDGQNYKFAIGISLKDCTGCSLCANICPGKKGKKALTMRPIDYFKDTVRMEENDYLFNHVTEKKVMNKKTVKGSQFRTPKFEFPGACAGCGETAYLRLLTQLFQNHLVISNATGCSSIYGASAPSTPYSVPWANSLFEDNAEYGYGMKIADDTMKRRIQSIIRDHLDQVKEEDKKLYTDYLEEITEETGDRLFAQIDKTPIKELLPLKEFIPKKTFFIVGGDGWAYDIGFGGIDHVLANKENVNILVLDTEVYSNTGGQASKSSRMGAIAKFASHGKETAKKDLAKIALAYPHVYVGTICLGANLQHTLKTILEAEQYDGPSLLIAYAPCIAQGILKGMSNTTEEQKKAVESGYFPLFHYNPIEGKLHLDSKADFSKYYEFIAGEDRYRMLKKVNKENYRELLEENRNNAIDRYEDYQELSDSTKEKSE